MIAGLLLKAVPIAILYRYRASAVIIIHGQGRHKYFSHYPIRRVIVVFLAVFILIDITVRIFIE